MTHTILILSGGGPAPRTGLPRADYVIAADSGLHLASQLGVNVDLVVGDLDSVSDAALEGARTKGVAVERHPTDKDATDLDLALLAALERASTRVVIAGGGAGRIDHLLGLALLLTDDRWRGIGVEWHTGTSVAYVVRGGLNVATRPGDLLSIIPITDSVASVTGTKWVLDRETLPRGTTRGVSNEAGGDSAHIEVHQGVALVIVTGEGQ